MGASRSAPDPKFEENLKAATEQPEGMGRTTSLMNAFTSGSNIMGRSGRATMSGLGASGGTGIQNALSGIVRPSASATIKAPESLDEEQDTEQNFEDVRTNLLAKAKERRSKLSEMKQEVASKLAMPSPTSELDKFSIENYRAGGAAFDRDDTDSVGDDMATGKPSTSERAKSFLSDMTGKGGFSAIVRTK
tara:strand:- start:63 stop:635 length:573 start_codon:yes stop_codon:yes gene_type:complete